MIVARMLFDSGDKAGAKAQLQWVIDRGSEEELKQIARYRLAEVQFDDKQYDDALRTLDAKQDEPFAGLYADLRGDILAAAKRTDEARTAYQTALAKVDAKSPYRNYIEVQLNA
jgi:predicted negative regulator of RcsB-dependent stress response